MLPAQTRRKTFLLILLLFLSLAGCRAAVPGEQPPSRKASTKNTDSSAASECRVPEVRGEEARAHAAVGEAYKACFEKTGDRHFARQAAEAYEQASRIGLERDGRIQHTREIADLLVRLEDKESLQEFFDQFLETDPARDEDGYYLALVDYADALARMGDESAWKHFERAVQIHPQNNIEAINRYARHLIDRGQPAKAAEMLERSLTKEQRIRFVRPAYLRQEALRRAGLDTASADEEIAVIEQRRGRSRGAGAAGDPGGRSGT